MALYKLSLGVAVVQDDLNIVVPVAGNIQTETKVSVEAADADAAFALVQAQIQQLFSAPLVVQTIAAATALKNQVAYAGNTNGGDFDGTLPLASAATRVLVKNIGIGILGVVTQGADKIEVTETRYELTTQFEAIELRSDGVSNWYVW